MAEPSLADYLEGSGLYEEDFAQPDGDGVVPSAPITLVGDPIQEPIDSDVVLGLFSTPDEFDEAFVEDSGEFHENLADYLSDSNRDALAQSVVDWQQSDRQSRAEWEILEAEGLKLLGVTPDQILGMNDTKPGEGDWGSSAVHPGLVQAVIQFWARIFPELWQDGAPAKAEIFGAAPVEQQQKAERKAEYLNYLYGTEMGDGMEELSQAVFRLPISGSVFRVPYFDPIEGTVRVVNAPTEDFVKPYSATKLRTAARYTYVMRKERNECRRLMAEGWWRRVELGLPANEMSDATSLRAVQDAAEGLTSVPDSGRNESEYSDRDKFFVTWCTLDLAEDYGWSDPEHDHEWGGPYRVTVHTETREVVELVRDWRPDDAKKRRRTGVVEYKYMPGTRGYGWSIFHLAGGLSRSQTALLQHSVDAATLDTIGQFTGWIDENIVGPQDAAMEMGKLTKVRGTGEDIRKAIWRPDYKYSANNNLNTLQYADGIMGQLTASTQEMVGDASKEVPVGTTLTRVEQHMKPVMAVMRLAYSAFAEELKSVAELVYDHMPDGRYPYRVKGEVRDVLRDDFGDDDVVPKANPNIVSTAQRMARFESMRDMALQDPDAWPLEERLPIYQYGMGVIGVDDDLMQRMSARIAEVEQMKAMAQANPQMMPPTPEEEAAMRADQAAQAEQARKDAATSAEIQRKDAMAQAEMQRKRELAVRGAEDKAAGNAAIVEQERQRDLEQSAARIMDMANERLKRMATDAGTPNAVPVE